MLQSQLQLRERRRWQVQQGLGQPWQARRPRVWQRWQWMGPQSQRWQVQQWQARPRQVQQLRAQRRWPSKGPMWLGLQPQVLRWPALRQCSRSQLWQVQRWWSAWLALLRGVPRRWVQLALVPVPW